MKPPLPFNLKTEGLPAALPARLRTASAHSAPSPFEAFASSLSPLEAAVVQESTPTEHNDMSSLEFTIDTATPPADAGRRVYVKHDDFQAQRSGTPSSSGISGGLSGTIGTGPQSRLMDMQQKLSNFDEDSPSTPAAESDTTLSPDSTATDVVERESQDQDEKQHTDEEEMDDEQDYDGEDSWFDKAHAPIDTTSDTSSSADSEDGEADESDLISQQVGELEGLLSPLSQDLIAMLDSNGARQGPISPVKSTPTKTKRKRCTCNRSRCLKLYCECFSTGKLCLDGYCKCLDCANSGFEEHEAERKKAIQRLLKKKGELAFRNTSLEKKQAVAQSEGCNCKKSRCVKKYCECYAAGLVCRTNCKCEDCGNDGEVPPPPIKRKRKSRAKKHLAMYKAAAAAAAASSSPRNLPKNKKAKVKVKVKVVSTGSTYSKTYSSTSARRRARR